ncbi:MAG TPA: cyclic nucleotide-binding domain-containing protein [Gaiellaceae bacterium]|nr:cyclic nucleotide-binding domain-containing protein [Gaiellaceae bacterium]
MEAVPVTERLAQLTLFADLRWAELEEVAHTFDEEVFGAGQRVLRQGISGGSFYVILEGEATVVIDGIDRSRLGRGDFFGEITALQGGVPIADVRADTLLRCLTLPGPQLEPFLLAHPTVMLRMLHAEARRLRDANRWN